VKTSQAGIDLIKSFEGLRLKAYVCPAGKLTIGYGHTEGVAPRDAICAIGAENLLRKDLVYFEAGVSKLLKVTVRQSQFDALVSFAFNLGLGALKRSTLLRKLNAGDDYGAADEFLRWNKSGGKVLEGLTRRRKAEREMFLNA
jgi:GH24 family phage-related lysozyme (muramidase)